MSARKNNKNPLSSNYALPPFGDIQPDHIGPAVDQVLTDSRATISDLEALVELPDWENFARVIESMEERIDRTWSPVTHLNSVLDSDQLRPRYEENLVKITEFYSALGQNKPLFDHYRSLLKAGKSDSYSASRRTIIDNAIRDFKLGGVALPKARKRRFRETQVRLSELQNRFSQNELDATAAWHLDVSDEQQLSGLPQSSLDMARNTAREAGADGWRLGLQLPSYLSVMMHADAQKLRETLYKAYTTRASATGTDVTSDGKFDNGPLITQILALRHEQAGLLGYLNYAETSLVTRMAGSAEQVLSFLRDLGRQARPVAKLEWDELVEFARNEYGVSELGAWDLAYYSEKLRQTRHGFTDEEVKRYFQVDQVLEGMFTLVGRVFGIAIEPVEGVETWHEAVRVYRIQDRASNETIGLFYTDLYVRAHKRGGAWMDTCIHRRRLHSRLQIPVAYLICNFAPPTDATPALLTHDEVTTLFHEFGHTLQHLLTEVDDMGVAGINGVPWDAVEFPSQFMENWCWQRESLDIIGRHYQTEEPLPDKLLGKMRQARNFQTGMRTVRQLEFALFDMLLHTSPEPPDEAGAHIMLDQVRSEIAVVTPPAYNRFENTFSHIFSGGYAAGYYSYLWAEVLAADAFSMFEQRGVLNTETGMAFRQSILARGGTENPEQLFREFRGRGPQIDALLRHNGLDGEEGSEV